MALRTTSVRRRNRAEELAVEKQALLDQRDRIDRTEDDARRRAQSLIDAAQKQIVDAERELERAERLDALEDETIARIRAVDREQSGLIAQLPLLADDVVVAATA